jgi:hypothetical protein
VRRVVLLTLLLGALAALGWCTADRVQTQGAAVESWALVQAWSLDVSSAQTIVYAPFTKGAAPALLIQGPPVAVIASPSGREGARVSLAAGSRTGATGDLDGDGADELVVARHTKDGPIVDVYDGSLRPLGQVGPIKSLGDPVRVLAADLDGDGKKELVVGDATGRIAAVTRQGRALWAFSFGTEAKGDEAALRGMDDVRAGGKGRLVMAARRKGEVVLLDGRGDVVRAETVKGLRRARALDLDGDGKDDIVLGTDGSGVSFLRGGATGAPEPIRGTGGVVTELRRIEADGDPKTTELAAGNRDGMVWTIGRGHATSFGRVTGRVTEVAGVDTNGDGRDEIVVGSEPDLLTVLDGQGAALAELHLGSPVVRVVPVPAAGGKKDAVVVAGGTTFRFSLTRNRAAFWYSPVSVFGVGLLMVLLAGVAVVRGGKQLPVLQVTDPAAVSGSGVAATRAHVQDLVRRGLASRDMAAERLAQLDAPAPAARRAAPGRGSPPPPPRRG